MKCHGTMLACLMISGCSALTSTVTWQPNLAGATIIEQKTGKLLGENVLAIQYQLRANHVTTPGCFDINGVTAKWPSGYESSTPDVIQLCRGYRDDYHVQIPYAANEQQRSVDVPYAVEYNRIMQHKNLISLEQNDRLMATAILAVSANAIRVNQSQSTVSQPVYNTQRHTGAVNQPSGCRSDYDCSSGMKCTKAPLSSAGVCLTPVNEFGTPQFRQLPDPDSVLPNYNAVGQCQFDTDCQIGFKCDGKLKVCVR